MKKVNQIASTVILGIAALAMTSCSKLPQEKVDAATLGVTEAQQAGADVYAAESFATLQDSLSAAMESIETEKSKFFKNFSDAELKLDGVISYTTVVKEETAANIETLKTEISTMIADIKSLIEQNNQLITQAPRGKEGTAALMAIKAEISTLTTTVTEVETLLSNGELMSAKEKATATKDQATAINTELADVIAKYNSARR